MVANKLFSERCDLLGRCQLLKVISGQDGLGMRVPCNDLALGWEYTANEFVEKRVTD